MRGDPETATKNWSVRRVPLIPEARELFERMGGAPNQRFTVAMDVIAKYNCVSEGEIE